MKTAEFLKTYCQRNDGDTLVVDETGVGAGVVDRLKELKIKPRLVPFIGGQRAENPERYVNRNAEVWWAMRERYRSGEMDTDDDPALIRPGVQPRVQGPDQWRTLLQGKDKMHRSPDEADALAMTFAAPRGGNRIWT